jgi:ribonuclease VapC
VRHGDAASGLVDLLMQELRLDVVPVDMTQLAIGLDAAIRYGVGRHAASLDVGDCSAYALAMMRGEPLLFVGDAFTRTDVTAVAW